MHLHERVLMAADIERTWFRAMSPERVGPEQSVAAVSAVEPQPHHQAVSCTPKPPRSQSVGKFAVSVRSRPNTVPAHWRSRCSSTFTMATGALVRLRGRGLISVTSRRFRHANRGKTRLEIGGAPTWGLGRGVPARPRLWCSVPIGRRLCVVIENSITSMLSETPHLAGLYDVPVMSAGGEISRRQPVNSSPGCAGPWLQRHAGRINSISSWRARCWRGFAAEPHLARSRRVFDRADDKVLPGAPRPRPAGSGCPCAFLYAARPRWLGIVVGRRGYARATTSHFFKSRSPRHGGGLSGAAGSRRHCRESRQWRPHPPGHRAARAPRSRFERAHIRAVLPGQSGGLVEYLPVLRSAGQPISSGLEGVGRASTVSGGQRRGRGGETSGASSATSSARTSGRAWLGLGVPGSLGAPRSQSARRW